MAASMSVDFDYDMSCPWLQTMWQDMSYDQLKLLKPQQSNRVGVLK